MRSFEVPPVWRIGLGFLIAPGVASVAMACWDPGFDGIQAFLDRLLLALPLFSLFAYSAAVLLGLPVFLLLAGRVRATVLSCMLAGSLIAAAPFLATGLFPSADHAQSGMHVTVDDGRLTLWGYLELAELVGQIAVFGSIAGLVFWTIVVPVFGKAVPRDLGNGAAGS